jgi:hypothetical protein
LGNKRRKSTNLSYPYRRVCFFDGVPPFPPQKTSLRPHPTNPFSRLAKLSMNSKLSDTMIWDGIRNTRDKFWAHTSQKWERNALRQSPTLPTSCRAISASPKPSLCRVENLLSPDVQIDMSVGHSPGLARALDQAGWKNVVPSNP